MGGKLDDWVRGYLLVVYDGLKDGRNRRSLVSFFGLLRGRICLVGI